MIILRPYQRREIDRLRSGFRKHRRLCFQLPTGAGKTLIFSSIAASVLSKGSTALVLVHRRELLHQAHRKLAEFGVAAGIIASGEPADEARSIQVASIQTLNARLRRPGFALPDAKLIVIDEAHHATSASYSSLLERYPASFLLGVTATPQRLDGKGLHKWFDALICGPGIRQLTDDGYLAQARVFAPQTVDRKAFHVRAGEYDAGEVVAAVKPIIGDAVGHYRRHLNGRQALAFLPTVDLAEEMAGRFAASGIAASHVDGGMARRTRDGVLRSFTCGGLSVLTSCELISEGFDVPEASGALLLRPTRSLAVYLQQVGRVMRPKTDGSKAVILDHVGNTSEHGLPSDHRDWSLADRPKKAQQAPVKTCPMCSAVMPSGAMACPECGHEFPPHDRNQRHVVDGTLVELGDGARFARLGYKQALATCETIDDLLEMARVRGYKRAWAFRQWRQRLATAQPWRSEFLLADFSDAAVMCRSMLELEEMAELWGLKKGWAWIQARERGLV